MIDLFIEGSLGTILHFLIFICYLKKTCCSLLVVQKESKNNLSQEKSKPPLPPGIKWSVPYRYEVFYHIDY